MSQQELVLNDTMIAKEQTINEKFDSLTEKELVFNKAVKKKFVEHEQKLQYIVSVNLYSFYTQFNSVLIELYIGRRYFSPEILCWTKRKFYSSPRIHRPFIC